MDSRSCLATNEQLRLWEVQNTISDSLTFSRVSPLHYTFIIGKGIGNYDDSFYLLIDRMNYYVPKALQEKYERDAIIRCVIDF